VLGLLPNYLLQNPDDSRARMIYAIELAQIDKKDDALRESSKALEISADDPMMLYNCACLYSRLGELQRAMEVLREAVAKGQLNFGWMKHDPDLIALRDNADFIALTGG
jgi:adenylate cyclase